MSETGKILLRISMSLVFLWFGLNQLFDPNTFLGYLPSYALDFASSMSIDPTLLIIGNGIFDTLFGLLLMSGIFVRIVALIIAIHIFSIGIGLGYNDVMIRDLGLTLATLSIYFNGRDKYCLKLKKFF